MGTKKDTITMPEDLVREIDTLLLELVAARVKEAIVGTRKTRKSLDNTLNKIGLK